MTKTTALDEVKPYFEVPYGLRTALLHKDNSSVPERKSFTFSKRDDDTLTVTARNPSQVTVGPGQHLYMVIKDLEGKRKIIMIDTHHAYDQFIEDHGMTTSCIELRLVKDEFHRKVFKAALSTPYLRDGEGTFPSSRPISSWRQR